MSYQRLNGSSWDGIGYGKTMYGLGAVAQTTLYNYNAAATALATAEFAKNSGAQRVVVTLELDGKAPVVTAFTNAEAASDAFEGVIATPGRRAYVGMWERSGIVGEQYFAAIQHVETRFTFDKLKSIAPYLIGGAALIAAAVYLSRRGKGRPGRRRSRALYRRRTVTVWR